MRGHRPVAREFVAERALGSDGTECVLWPFQIRDGYGVLWTPRPDRKLRSAHRAVLDAAGIESVAHQTEIRHLCGVRRCVNLARLKWGTKSENQRDRFQLHGDSHAGERNNRAVLTDSDVIAIRASALPYAELASMYGVSQSNIAMVRSGRTWSHLLDREAS